MHPASPLCLNMESNRGLFQTVVSESLHPIHKYEHAFCAHQPRSSINLRKTDQGTKEPRNQGTKEPGNQGTKEPRNQGTREPRNQGTREPGNQGTREPGNQGTREPGNQGTREPRNQGTKTWKNLVLSISRNEWHIDKWVIYKTMTGNISLNIKCQQEIKR